MMYKKLGHYFLCIGRCTSQIYKVEGKNSKKFHLNNSKKQTETLNSKISKNISMLGK